MTGFLGSKKDKNTKKITWTSDFPLQGRKQACDSIPFGDNPGTLLSRARNIDSIKDFFNLLLGDKIFDRLVRETKTYIGSQLEKWSAQQKHLFQSSKYLYFCESSPLEMCTLTRVIQFDLSFRGSPEISLFE